MRHDPGVQGREAAEQLLDRVKTGAIVAVTGKVQPHVTKGSGPVRCAWGAAWRAPTLLVSPAGQTWCILPAPLVLTPPPPPLVVSPAGRTWWIWWHTRSPSCTATRTCWPRRCAGPTGTWGPLTQRPRRGSWAAQLSWSTGCRWGAETTRQATLGVGGRTGGGWGGGGERAQQG